MENFRENFNRLMEKEKKKRQRKRGLPFAKRKFKV
jgi:hypothetical protein